MPNKYLQAVEEWQSAIGYMESRFVQERRMRRNETITKWVLIGISSIAFVYFGLHLINFLLNTLI